MDWRGSFEGESHTGTGHTAIYAELRQTKACSTWQMLSGHLAGSIEAIRDKRRGASSHSADLLQGWSESWP